MKLYRDTDGDDYYCNHEEVITVPMRATGSSVNDGWYLAADEDRSDGLLIITAKWLLPDGIVGVPIGDPRHTG